MKMRSMVITALYYIYIYTYIYFEGREWRNSQKTKTNEMSRALAPSLKPGPRLINDNFDSSSSCYHYTHFFFFLSSFLPLTTQCTKRCWKLCLRNGTRACNKRSRRVDSTSSKIKCQKIKAKKKKRARVKGESRRSMALNSEHLQVPLIVGFISDTKACLPLTHLCECVYSSWFLIYRTTANWDHSDIRWHWNKFMEHGICYGVCNESLDWDIMFQLEKYEITYFFFFLPHFNGNNSSALFFLSQKKPSTHRSSLIFFFFFFFFRV